VPLFHKHSYEIDVHIQEHPIATTSASMRIVWGAVHPKVLEGLVHESLLDTQTMADLVYIELLLIKQHRDPGFQVARDGAWRHYGVYVNKSLISFRESNPGTSRGSKQKYLRFRIIMKSAVMFA
jgi:hypothetical protein